MANAEHLKILKEGVEVWNRWREENEGIKPDLNDIVLNDVDLHLVNLSNSNLQGAVLHNVTLGGAKLQSANLSGADLGLAYLDRAILEYAILINTDLGGAVLRNANLKGANLSGARLSLSDMSGTNLQEADLSFTNLIATILRKCNLNHSNMNGAMLDHSVFSLTDLSTCIGLESVEINGPCSIDFQTLRASRNLPKSFLLKIGLPENYIDYLPDFYENDGIRYHPSFLSHSWANKPFARQLYEALIAKGVNVFFDEKKMKPGDDIFTGISRGIELYDKTILVCSEESLNSWWVDQELELVFEKERKLQKETGEKTGLLIPIKIDNAIDTWPNGKRMAIKQRIIGDFTNWQDPAAFEKALTDLVGALNADRKEVGPVSYLRKKA